MPSSSSSSSLSSSLASSSSSSLRSAFLTIIVPTCAVSLAAACTSSHTFIKPTSPGLTTSSSSSSSSSTSGVTTTPRPNISFPIFTCPPTYAAWYCLNEAVCFSVAIGDEILYNCECTNGFIGPRCEYKEVDGSYLPTRQRAMLETASIASGATLALLFMLITCWSLFVRYESKMKLLKMQKEDKNGIDNEFVDEVDSIVKVPEKLRPFGPHHHKIHSLSCTLKRYS